MLKKGMIWLLLIGLAAAGFSNVAFDKPSYEPNEVAILTIQGNIQYVNPQNPPVELTGTSVRIYFPWGTETQYLGDFSICNECVIPFSLRVPIIVREEGIYDVRVRLEGNLEFLNGRSRNLVYETIVPLKVERIPTFNITISPDTLPTKGTLELTICTDTPVKNLEINHPMFITTYHLQRLEGCDSINVTYKDGIPGNITLTYKTNLGTKRSQQIPYKLTFFKEKPRFIITAQDIYSNVPSQFTLKIKNNGEIAKDVTIRSFNITLLDGEISLGDLLTEKEVNVKGYTRLPPGIYEAMFEVSWKEDGNERSQLIPGSIEVLGKDDLEIYIELGSEPKQDEPFTLSVVVANKELYKIHSVTVEVDTPLIIIDGDPKKYIGEIEGDDYNSQQFTLIPNQSGPVNITLNVTYKTSLGETKQHTTTKTIFIKQAAKEEFPWYVIGVIVVGILAWWRWKR